MRSTRTIGITILYVITLLLAVLMWNGTIRTGVAMPQPLTLTDVGHWTPTATLDTTQVETPAPQPIPAPAVCEAVDTAYLPETAILDLVDETLSSAHTFVLKKKWEDAWHTLNALTHFMELVSDWTRMCYLFFLCDLPFFI